MRHKTMTKTMKLRAVEVAYDVLASLRQFNVKSRNAFVNQTNTTVLEAALALNGSREQAEALKKGCEVCALGACLLSTVRLYNKFNFSTYGEGRLTMLLGPGVVHERLSKVFTTAQMVLIEKCFEEGRGHHDESYVFSETEMNDYLNKRTQKKIDDFRDQVHRATAFGYKYDDDTRRLRAIMKNIIANDGEFTPQAKKTKKAA